MPLPNQPLHVAPLVGAAGGLPARRGPGVGVQLENEDGTATVLAVDPGTPAAKAGVQPGDRIAAINDSAVAGLKPTDVALRLTGPKGSKVRIRIRRGPRLEPDTLSLTLTREALRPPPMAMSRMADGVTGYVRLSWFGPMAGDQLRDAVRGLQAQGARRLVLDLRDNPGGILDMAVDIASEFLPKGALVFRTGGRSEERRVGEEGRSRWAPYHLKKKSFFMGRSYYTSECHADYFGF